MTEAAVSAPVAEEEEDPPRQPDEPCWHEEKGWECYSFECRAEVWQGPEGLTPNDLRYSVIISISDEWRVGDRWPRPYVIKGVTWKFDRRDNDGCGWTDFVYAAAMDFPAFQELLWNDYEGSQNGGIVGPPEARGWWAPSVVYDGDNKKIFVTAWPKVRYEFAGPDEHLFDEWDAICMLLIGKPSWESKDQDRDRAYAVQEP